MTTERKTFTVPAAEIRAQLEALDKERARLKRILKLAEEEERFHQETTVNKEPVVNGEAAPTVDAYRQSARAAKA